jgi:hypothetical protein
VDYVVIDRLSIDGHDSEEDMAPIPREIEVAGRPLRVIAEFGPWVLARVSDIGRHARGGA